MSLRGRLITVLPKNLTGLRSSLISSQEVSPRFRPREERTGQFTLLLPLKALSQQNRGGEPESRLKETSHAR